jgi:6,7-dimethyl-8-ribityllumazine synthase
MHVIEGNLVVPEGARFGLVATRFNHFIVDRLVEGANDALLRHGARSDAIMLVRVPGAWELPFAVRRLASSKKVDAVIALGAVIRGATPHFEYIATETAKGIAAAAAASAIPVVFGVLTTDTIDQAVERAGAKAGNKGWDAAVGAIEMVALERALDREGL